MLIFDFISLTPITKGWSADKKYCVITADGRKYLLRISPAEHYNRKKAEFEMMQQLAALGVPMCQPVEFGTCDDGVYSLQSWIDGKGAEELLPLMSDAKQCKFGFDAGQILKKIHTLPGSSILEDWETRFNRKIDRNIRMYNDCPIKHENGQAFTNYINENR